MHLVILENLMILVNMVILVNKMILVNLPILVISINYVILVILVKPDYDESCDSGNF